MKKIFNKITRRCLNCGLAILGTRSKKWCSNRCYVRNKRKDSVLWVQDFVMHGKDVYEGLLDWSDPDVIL